MHRWGSLYETEGGGFSSLNALGSLRCLDTLGLISCGRSFTPPIQAQSWIREYVDTDGPTMRLHTDGPTIFLHTDGQTPAGTRLPDRYDGFTHQAQLAVIGVLSEYMSIGSGTSAH